jgi:flagellar biosynthesis protein FliR
MLGFVSNIFLAGIELAGSLMDTQAGLSVASVLDPSSGQNAALLQQWFKWIAMIIFLIVGGDRMLLSAIYKSFFILPVGHPVNLSSGSYEIMMLFKNVFLIGCQLSAPILLVVFIVDYAFGIMNRVAEQINVFQLGFQIKPTVSLFVLMSTLPGLIYVITSILSQVLVYMMQVMKALAIKTG